MNRLLVAGWSAILFASLVPGAASAQDDAATAEAKQHFEAARSLYKQAAYKEAIAEFQKAYSLVPNAASSGLLLYNIASCYEKLGDVPAALRAYKDYLRAVPNADDRSEVMTTINNLEKRLREKGIQQVRVYSTPAGANVAVNGENKGITPFSIEVVPGKYFLTLTKKGYRPVEKDFVMSGDTSLELDFTLNEVKLAEVAPVPAPVPAAKPDDKVAPKPPETGAAAQVKSEEGGGRIWTWVLGGVGLAAIGSGVAFGVLASQADSDLHGSPHSSQEAQNLADTAQQDALIANIAFGVGGALIVGSVVLFFVEGKSSKSAALEAPIPNVGFNVTPHGDWLLSFRRDF